MSIENRLKELGIELPAAPVPLASYVTYVRTGQLLYVSGQGPMVDGKPVITGKVGDTVSEEEAVKAARLTAINALAIVSSALGGLDRVARIVKLNGYVNCDNTFARQHIVVNGASELIVDVFGEKGRHARTAIGTNALPMDIPVELELVVEATE